MRRRLLVQLAREPLLRPASRERARQHRRTPSRGYLSRGTKRTSTCARARDKRAFTSSAGTSSRSASLIGLPKQRSSPNSSPKCAIGAGRRRQVHARLSAFPVPCPRPSASTPRAHASGDACARRESRRSRASTRPQGRQAGEEKAQPRAADAGGCRAARDGAGGCARCSVAGTAQRRHAARPSARGRLAGRASVCSRRRRLSRACCRRRSDGPQPAHAGQGAPALLHGG